MTYTENNILENAQRAEKVAKILSIISITAIAIGIIAGVTSLINGSKLLDTIATYGLTLFVLPYIVLQVAMPANISTYGTKSMGMVSWAFFLIVFPFVDLWFFSGINALYNIVPDYHIIDDRTIRELARDQYVKEAWAYIATIYFSLIGLGLTIRFFKKKFVW